MKAESDHLLNPYPGGTPQHLKFVEEKAREIRLHVLRMAKGKGEGYVGQGLGAADILAACYFSAMKWDPLRPLWEERDRFLLSTGHYSIVLYATLTAAGLFSEELLSSYGADESSFAMTSCENTPGVEITGGSLGQGLSQAVEMGLGSRLSGRHFRVLNFLSDGELQEGSTWEAALAASHYGLDRLTALVDVNGVQADGRVADIMGLEPIVEKWQSFGWHARSLDGNSLPALLQGFQEAYQVKGKPQVLVCSTVMGKGVPFLEERPRQHFIRVDPEEWDLALQVLEEAG